jgi:hypothetical protein
MEKRIPNVKIVTPKGIAQYPHLTKADTKFSEVGEFKTSLILPKQDASEILKAVDRVCGQSLNLAKDKTKGEAIKEAPKPYQNEVDDSGKETGNVVIKFKCKAKVTTKSGESFDNKPAIFDAKGNPLTNVNIWGGTQMKVSAELIPYYTNMVGAGVSLRLRAVQILKLVEGGTDSSGFGFEKEDGYEHHTETVITEEPNGTSTNSKEEDF